MDESMTSDMIVPPELIGLEALLSPFCQFTSTQRLAMFASNLAQAVVVHGAEMPRISTGWENLVGKYEFEKSEAPADMRIIAVIPKFKVNIGSRQLSKNPSLTVIYETLDPLQPNNSEIGYFDVKDYTKLSNGFGYINKKSNTNYLVKDNFVPKGTEFTTSPNHDGNFYMQGVNANVIYMSVWGVTDDAFEISDELAAKLEHTVIKSLKVDIPIDATPTNLYGNQEEYKFFPDIGEKVDQNGILMGFRPNNAITFMGDHLGMNLTKPQYLHDVIYPAPPGAEVIDVQVYMDHRVFRNVDGSVNEGVHTQLHKYQVQHNRYYQAICDVYESLKKDGKTNLSDDFNNLVTRSLALLSGTKGKSSNVRLLNGKDPINIAHVEVTYKHTRKVSKGFKLTGRDGSKGVCSAIRKKEDMPMDEHGYRADIIIYGGSVVNRLNPSQWYEQDINMASENVKRKVITSLTANEPIDKIWSYITEYLTDIRPLYGSYVAKTTRNRKEQFVNTVKEQGIYLVIPPYCKDITPERMRYINAKYGVTPSHITYRCYTDINDTVGSLVTTVAKTIIGSKYLYLLGKIPTDQLNSIEMGYVSQFNTPLKSSNKGIKVQQPFGCTPVRIGEDEVSMLDMSNGTEHTVRNMGLYSGSPKAVEKLETALLTAKNPSDIDNIDISTKEIIDSNVNVAILKSMLAIEGYGTTEEEGDIT